ncbi:MAG: hypothetical protein N2578_00920 [Bdellovibrionaceae bacterium]|nr:hypothetical protein [Pseudobdellovibrionaceae bacterium]
MRRIFFLALLVSAFQAHAHRLVDARWDRTTQTLSLDLIYTGGCEEHNFSLLFGECQRGAEGLEIAARLVDTGWRDICEKLIRQTVRIDLSQMTCRPAALTVIATVGRQTVLID